MSDKFEVVNIRHYRINFDHIAFDANKLLFAGKPGQAKKLAQGQPKEKYLHRYSTALKPFKPAQEGGRTEVTVRDNETGKEYLGAADCSMEEVFCYKTGVGIAKKRALREMGKDREDVLYAMLLVSEYGFDVS